MKLESISLLLLLSGPVDFTFLPLLLEAGQVD
ncbi:hypothetical protein ZEAMMB73_Zm00001d035864 [Zea mays]|uniref:Uncharacterized protein n=1 Tax=Zea mays TaxID=4577 RepID=A0A1D6LJ31_MAIZE|nr:hypothetical protein ZEAMMB73_Zm00001d035864 [Zea mays]